MISSFITQKRPIFIVGLPRSGTSWVASVLNTAEGIKYFYEPFNRDQVPEATPYWLKYLRVEDRDREFENYCRRVFAGELDQQPIIRKLAKPYSTFQGRLRWLPGRIMVKDVHSCLALSWIHHHINPVIVIVLRHPCAMASSWYRVFKSTAQKNSIKGLQRMLEQPLLIQDYLNPFEDILLQKNSNFWYKVGLYWGATYFILQQQIQHNPDWIVVKHEDLCANPVKNYQSLFSKLDLVWTERTEQLLVTSTQQDSKEAYSPSRITSQEPNKWQNELENWQIESVMNGVEPFQNVFY